MTTPRQRLEGFLAKVHDVPRGDQKGTSEAEAQGAVQELVRRLRLLHQAGEGDLWLVLLTTEEKQKLEAYRARVEGAPAPQPKPGPARAQAPGTGRRPMSTREVVEKTTKVTAVLDELGAFDWLDRVFAPEKKDDEDGGDGL